MLRRRAKTTTMGQVLSMETRLPDEITKEFLQGCLDHASAAVYAKDREGRYLFVNRRFWDLFGVDVLGKTDYELFPREIADRFRRFDRDVMVHGAAIDGEEAVPTRRGERIYWSVKVPLRDARGHVYGMAGISSDVTDRKETERERDATLVLLDTFMSRSPVGFAVLDRELRYIRINETLANLNALAIEGHIGRTVREVVPEVADEVEQVVRTVMDTGAPTVNVEFTFKARATPAEPRSFLASFYPIVIGAETTAVGAVLSEITEQKRIAEQRKRDTELRELVMAVLAHDLRSPLSSITMTARLLLESDEPPEARARGMQRILRSATRMSELIAQVLDFTRIRSGGGLVLDTGPVDLEELCSNLLEEFRAAHPECEFELHTQGDVRGLWDNARLSQVVANLVSNAVTHGAQDCPVHLSLRGEADHVTLAVRNHGGPLTDTLKASLFEPFHRSDPELSRGPRDGLGLGLYISERIVAGHGGRIWADSDEHSTVFSVLLPRAVRASGP